MLSFATCPSAYLYRTATGTGVAILDSSVSRLETEQSSCRKLLYINNFRHIKAIFVTTGAPSAKGVPP